MRLCHFFCCGRKVNFVQIPYSHDRFSKILRTFFVKKMVPYKTYVREDQLCLTLYGSTTIRSLLFFRNIENFVWFSKQYLLGFSILKIQLLIFWTGVSCFSVTLFYSSLFCCGRKANIVWFTLFYSTLLTLTDRRNDRRRNKYTCFEWAGGTFFPVVLLCCVSFWFWWEMRELPLHYFPADCFGIKWEIVFGVTYVLSVQYSCAVVPVFLLWRES